MVDIVVVGSCNIDQIVYTQRLPDPGETVLGVDYQVGFGGKGANQCVAAAKLGARVSMISMVGNDDNGKKYIKNFENLGVDVSHVSISDDSCTGVAPITVSADGANCIVVFPGANMLLSVNDINAAAQMLESAKILLCQMEINRHTTLHALRMARDARVTTFLNIAPAAENISDDFFKYSDIVCVNETEASILTNEEVIDFESATSAAKKLLMRGCSICIITLGGEGCVCVDHEGSINKIPVDQVEVKDSTGAGDAFVGAFAVFFCQLGLSHLDEILAKSNAVAAMSVTRKGTQVSYPTQKELPIHLLQ